MISPSTYWRVVAVILCVWLAGCSTTVEEDPDMGCTDNFVPKTFDHHVIGFYPAYKHSVLPVSDIRWDLLTRVIYAFAIPQTDGTLDISRLSQIESLVASAHSQGVEVYLSVGGGGGSGNFPVLAQSTEARRTFVESVSQFVKIHCMDGVDIDWESWTKDANNAPLASESNDLMALLRELDAELGTAGLSIDVFASNWFGQHYPDLHSVVDHVHVMAYDFTGPWSDAGPHSSYDMAIGSGSSANSTGLAYWTAYRKWPKTKVILGVPFYGRDFDQGGGNGIAYRDILTLDSEAPNKDRVNNIYYNGLQTITDKTQYVVDNGFPGVMIWEIAQDVPESGISLLEAIDQVANP